MKFLSVDFGEKRIGLATSDASGSIATPRRTVRRASDEQAAAEIARFAREEEVDRLVVGLPHHADGNENELAPRVRAFSRKLERATGLPLDFINEHLTSEEGRRRGGSRAGPDAAAAAVILEDFLSARAK